MSSLARHRPKSEDATRQEIEEIEAILSPIFTMPMDFDESLLDGVGKKGYLNDDAMAKSHLHLSIGPLLLCGMDKTRGAFWKCSLLFILVAKDDAAEPPKELDPIAFAGSIHFFGDNAERERRVWIAGQRKKGRTVQQLPTNSAIDALDKATASRLSAYGIKLGN